MLGMQLREPAINKGELQAMFLFQYQFEQPKKAEQSLFSIVENGLRMSEEAKRLVKSVLEGGIKSTELYFGNSQKSEIRREESFRAISRLSGHGISCEKGEVTVNGQTYLVLRISKESAEGSKSLISNLKIRPAGKRMGPKPSGIAFQDAKPDKTHVEQFDAYKNIVSAYGEKFVSSAIKAATEFKINPLVLLSVVTSEQTSYDPKKPKHEAELEAFGKAMKRNPNSRNYTNDSRHIRPGVEVSHALAQMQETTFNDLGMPFTFEEMKSDYRLALRASAAYIKRLEKRLRKIDPGITTYSNPRLVAVAYIRPVEADKAARKALNGENWEEHYRQNRINGLPVYFAKVDGYYNLLETKKVAAGRGEKEAGTA